MNSASFFFQQPVFIFRNGHTGIVSFKGIDNTAIHFAEIDQQLISGAKSPFGSFVIPETPDKKSLKAILDEVLYYAKANSIESIQIKSYPVIYAPLQAALVSDVLGEAGFFLEYRDITQVLSIIGDMNLDPDRKRKITACIQKKFTFEELTVESLPEAYDLFLQSRLSKGYPVTMKLIDFFDEFRRFPLNYKLFGLLDGNKLIAASVVVLINDEIIYYFFSGDNLDYRKYSPITYLIFNLYHLASKKRFKFIDMGISTDKGILNQGLYDFKKSFGAFDSLKSTFMKKV